LLEVNDLRTSFFTDAGEVKAVNGVSFRLDRGKVLGIVGESGSGKSVTAYSIMQILASTGKIVGGSIKFDGQELVNSGEKTMRKVRGNRISIIFQDPMTSLNPTHTIGHQITEAILLHTGRNKKQAYERAVEIIESKRKTDQDNVVSTYPENEDLKVLKGRFGIYISLNKQNYKIPKTYDATNLTYQDCMDIINDPNNASKKRGKKS
jgi:oligopeptide transport system ATP-binding protein